MACFPPTARCRLGSAPRTASHWSHALWRGPYRSPRTWDCQDVLSAPFRDCLICYKFSSLFLRRLCACVNWSVTDWQASDSLSCEPSGNLTPGSISSHSIIGFVLKTIIWSIVWSIWSTIWPLRLIWSVRFSRDDFIWSLVWSIEWPWFDHYLITHLIHNLIQIIDQKRTFSLNVWIGFIWLLHDPLFDPLFNPLCAWIIAW